MTDDGPKRPNYKGRQNTPTSIDPELASELIDILAQFPEIARAWHLLLDKRGTTIEVKMHEFFASEFHKLGIELPRGLKEYLAEHYEELSPSIRKALFRNDLN